MLTFHCRLCPAWYVEFKHLVGHWELVHDTPARAWDVRREIVPK